MPLTSNLNGDVILARDASEPEPYYGLDYRCPDCSGAMILKAGPIKICHFAHKVSDPNCLYEGETEAHLAFKLWMTERLEGAQVEFKIGNTRYDVAYGDYVFECQISPISATEFEQREDNAEDLDLHLTWVWGVQHHMKISQKGNGRFLRANEVKQSIGLLHYWMYPNKQIQSLELTEPKWSCGGQTRDGFEYESGYCKTLWMFKSHPRYFEKLLDRIRV